MHHDSIAGKIQGILEECSNTSRKFLIELFKEGIKPVIEEKHYFENEKCQNTIFFGDFVLSGFQRKKQNRQVYFQLLFEKQKLGPW